VTAPTFTLAVETVRIGGTPRTAVSVAGEVDVTNATDFRTAVEGVDGPHPLIVDLSHLRYLDSAGFAALDQLLARRAAVIVLDPNSTVHPAAMLAGLPCHPTVDAAVHAGAAPG